MKIQYEDSFGSSKEILVQEAFEYEPWSETTGAFEATEELARNTEKKLARLGVLLQQKGLLQAHEILDIAGIYHTNCRFIAED